MRRGAARERSCGKKQTASWPTMHRSVLRLPCSGIAWTRCYAMLRYEARHALRQLHVPHPPIAPLCSSSSRLQKRWLGFMPVWRASTGCFKHIEREALCMQSVSFRICPSQVQQMTYLQTGDLPQAACSQEVPAKPAAHAEIEVAATPGLLAKTAHVCLLRRQSAVADECRE